MERKPTEKKLLGSRWLFEHTPEMLAGATAGSIGRLPVHPMDTMKSRLQVIQSMRGSGAKAYDRLWHGMKHVIKSEGFLGLYRGFGTAVVGAAPASCLYFTSYELSKPMLLNMGLEQNAFVAHFASGIIAEAVSCLFWAPTDVIKERLQVQDLNEGSTKYRGTINAIQVILKQEGVVGLYRGYGSTLLSFGPFSGLYFMFYEQWKSVLSSLNPSEEKLTGISHLFCGASAGAMASLCTHPLDTIKLRLQVQRGDGMFKFGYKNTFHGLYVMSKTEGIRSLFRGASARILYHAPSTAITVSLYESFKSLYQDWLLEEES